MDTVQPLIEIFLTTTKSVTLLHYVESPAVPEAQQPLHIDAEKLEGDPQDHPQGQEGHQAGHQADHRAGHQAEVDRLTGAHQGIPVTAPHKTITEGHCIEDSPQLLIGIRSAI